METVHPLEVGNLVLVRDEPRELTGFILEVYPPDEDNLYKRFRSVCGGYKIQHPDGVLIFVEPDNVTLLARG